MAQDRINDDIFRRLDTQDAKLDRIAEDVAYMRGMQDAERGGAMQPVKEGWLNTNKNNVIVVALAGLISTVAAVIGKLTGGN